LGAGLTGVSDAFGARNEISSSSGPPCRSTRSTCSGITLHNSLSARRSNRLPTIPWPLSDRYRLQSRASPDL